MNQIKYGIIFCAFAIILTISSCSLNYNKSAAHFEKRPNMVFKNIVLEKYEKNKITMKITSERLEMYETEKIWAGKNLQFIQFPKNKTDKNELSGFAGAALIDNSKDEYFLGKNVEFKSEEDGLKIRSTALYWLKKEHILFSPENQMVSIQKNNEVSLTGFGFSANTLSKTFELNSNIKGLIETEKESPEEPNSILKSESAFSVKDFAESGLNRNLFEPNSGGLKSE